MMNSMFVINDREVNRSLPKFAIGLSAAFVAVIVTLLSLVLVLPLLGLAITATAGLELALIVGVGGLMLAAVSASFLEDVYHSLARLFRRRRS